MIKLLSHKLLYFTLKNTQHEEDMIPVYRYGLEIMISSIYNIILIFMISVLFKEILSGIVFMICFIPLRQYTGGYHADSYLKCNFIFGLSFLIVLLLSHYFIQFDMGIIKYLILIFGCIIVYVFSPVKNINKIISYKKQRDYKKKAVLIYILASLFSIIFGFFNKYYEVLIILTLFLITILIIITLPMRKGGESYDE